MILQMRLSTVDRATLEILPAARMLFITLNHNKAKSDMSIQPIKYILNSGMLSD